MGKEWRLDTNAWIEAELERRDADGAIERRAKRDGISYGDAMIQLCEEIERPFREIRAKYATKQDATLDENALDKKAAAYADRHGVSYTVALDALIGTTPGAQRSVELEAPLPVDDADAAINRKATSYARRKGVSFEVALEAVLTEEVA